MDFNTFYGSLFRVPERKCIRHAEIGSAAPRKDGICYFH
jgi:hypothetical protein